VTAFLITSSRVESTSRVAEIRAAHDVVAREHARRLVSGQPAGAILRQTSILEHAMIGIIGFLFWSAVVLTPAILAVSVAARFLRDDRFVWPARWAVAAGFLAGGVIGWASVPAEWTASIWTTIDAAGNSAKYSEPFEHTAERALMYFFYSALLGELAFCVAALLVAWRLSDARSPRRLVS
jgi:hypothetical protein